MVKHFVLKEIRKVLSENPNATGMHELYDVVWHNFPNDKDND